MSASPCAGREAGLVADGGGDPPRGRVALQRPGRPARRARRSSRVTPVKPYVSRSWSSSAGSTRLPRTTLPARVDSVSASARAAAASRVRRAARSTVTLTATATAQEDDQREHVLVLGDGELVDRRREVVVEQQRCRRPPRPAPATGRRPARRRRPSRGRAGCRWAGTASSRSWVEQRASAAAARRAASAKPASRRADGQRAARRVDGRGRGRPPRG